MLHARDLWFAYEARQWVLEQLGCSVREGRLMGIVGPNGSGKSTLLRLLCGLLAPQRGEVMIEGKPVRRLAGRERAKLIAFLPQSVSPAFSLCAFEVVCLGRYPHAGGLGNLAANDLEIARRCMAQTHTDSLRRRPFSALSGGERQRVLLASILAQEPRFLLLDEPTSALDIHHQVEVMALLRQLTRKNLGAAIVLHDLNLAGQFCDEILLLGAAHTVLAAGPPETVLTGELLSQAYQAPIQVGVHPFTGAPFVSAGTGEPRL